MTDHTLCPLAQRARENRVRFTDSPKWVEITYEEIVASAGIPFVNILEKV